VTHISIYYTTVTDSLEYMCVLCGQTEEKRFVEELIVRDSHKHELRFMAHEDYYDAFRNEGEDNSSVAVCCSVLQCVAVCCSVLQCVAVCCSVLQCVAVCCGVALWHMKTTTMPFAMRVRASPLLLFCSVLQCVTVCFIVLQCSVVWCITVHCGAVCCSVLQCVAVLFYGT